jgi:coenzyme F420-reducing hydrogenase beta subunit
MRFDEYGISYPVVDRNKCVNCGLCNAACPYLNQDRQQRPQGGGFPPVYACYNKDEITRSLSTSGGTFSVLANYVIKKEGAFFAARFDKNFKIVHAKAQHLAEIDFFRGSKYAQSEIGTIYRDIKAELTNNREVLFVGTPCQVAGLKQFLNKSYEKLYTVDFICMGITSPVIWKSYLTQCEDIEKISQFVFKDKKDGWHNWQIKISYSDGKEKYMERRRNPFMAGYLAHLYYRPSCFACPFKGISRISDFTIGDCWGIDKSVPEFDDNKGVTVLILQSEKAKKLFECIKSDLVYRDFSANMIKTYNKYSCESVKKNKRSTKFFRILKKENFTRAVEKCLKDDCISKAIIKIKSRITG